MRPALREFQAGTRNKVSDNARDQDFGRLGLRHHARGGMHGDATNILAPDLDFTGVKTCAQR